jgi:hypothetical protein
MEQSTKATEVSVLFDRAVALERAGETERAIGIYRECLALSPLAADVLNNLGVLLCMNGRYAEGIVYLRQAITLNPLDPDYWCSVAEHLLVHAQNDEALHCVRQALSISPRHEEAIRLLKLAEPEPVAQAQPFVAEGAPAPQGPRAPAPLRILLPPDSTVLERIKYFFQQTRYGAWLLLILAVGGAACGWYAYAFRGAAHPTYRAPAPLPSPFAAPTYTVDLVKDRGATFAAILFNQKWAPGQMARVLKRSKNHLVMASNSTNDKVGEVVVQGHIHAAFWRAGILTDLGALPGDLQSCAYGINDQGVIVGTSGAEHHRAVIWIGSQIYDLNDRADTNGLRLTDALFITNEGEIYVRARALNRAAELVRMLPR